MLPSRSDILAALKKAGTASPRSLATLLGVTKKEMTEFKRMLRGLRSEDTLISTGRRQLALPRRKLTGEFLDTERGFGFVRPQNGGADIYIAKWQRSGARDGDIVEFEITDPRRGAGRVERVIERLPSTIGVVTLRGGSYWLLPFRKSMEEILIDSPSVNLKPNTIARVEIVHGRKQRTGRVEEVLGDFDTDGIEERVILEMHKRPVEFSEQALREADEYSPTVTPAMISERTDYRDLLCFTIDPDDAKDFDDAVSLQPGNSRDTLILGVHIADVAHYVRPGTALDADARSRACSVYFPRGVVPMLPLRLSSDLCSLRAGVDRLAFSVMMEVNRKGEVIRSEFHPSVIRSAARLTYTQAMEILAGKAAHESRPEIGDALRQMSKLADRMFAIRREQGSLDFDLPEPLLHFDTAGDLVHISPYPRLATHRLVEEFMLAANQAVAEHLYKSGVHTVYRVHEVPDPEKVDELNEVLEIFRIPSVGLPDPKPGDFQRAIDLAQKLKEEKFLTYKILRTMMLARYSPENLGHFGLAKTFYLHFTSPIRRYPDLVAHRSLRAAVGADQRRLDGDLDLLSESTSRLERDAEQIENEIVAWKVARFMRKHMGDVYDAVVIGYSASNLIVELDELYIEGKVRIDSIPGRWELDRRTYALASGKKQIRLADRVKVQVVAVDMRRRDVIFMLVRPE